MSSRIICPLLLLALFATASAHGGDWHDDDHHHDDHKRCIECKDCKSYDNWCYSNCQKECRGGRPEQGIDIEKCKRYGNDIGWNAAQAACNSVTTFCKGASRSFSPPPAKVSLAQCGNAAFGVCQNMARDRKSPCSWAFDKGMYNCNKDLFWQYYGGYADSECSQATAKFDRQ